MKYQGIVADRYDRKKYQGQSTLLSLYDIVIKIQAAAFTIKRENVTYFRSEGDKRLTVHDSRAILGLPT